MRRWPTRPAGDGARTSPRGGTASHGYEVVDRNWRLPAGELDLVVCAESLVVFCEVKTRASDAFGRRQAAVGRAKQRRLRLPGRRVAGGARSPRRRSASTSPRSPACTSRSTRRRSSDDPSTPCANGGEGPAHRRARRRSDPCRGEIWWWQPGQTYALVASYGCTRRTSTGPKPPSQRPIGQPSRTQAAGRPRPRTAATTNT